MNRVGYDWLICNKDGRIFFADHGLYPLEKGDKVWNNNEIDGYSVSAFVEDKKKRYKSLVSWEDEQPFDIYEFFTYTRYRNVITWSHFFFYIVRKKEK